MSKEFDYQGIEVVLTQPDGTKKVLYRPNSQPQVDYHKSIAPNVLLYGNRGGGKSYCARWDAHMKALANPDYRYCILRRTFPELQKTHLDNIEKEMEQLGGYFNKGEKIAYYPNGSKGTFAHCDDDKATMKLLSAEFDLMFFDELSTFEWEMFTKLASSCRVPKDSGLIAMVRAGTNPLGVSAEDIMHYFVDKDVDPEDDPDYVPDDWQSIKIQAEDNENLDTEQYQKRFSGMPAHVRKAWVDGEFTLENAMFEVRPQKKIYDDEGRLIETIPYHYIDRLDVEELVKRADIYRAYDHGYFPDPALCLWVAHLGNKYIVFHEELWFKTIAANIAKDIKSITQDLGIKRVVDTYCDPTIDFNTGADIHTIMDTFEMNGIPMTPSVNDRALYASAIHSALAMEIEPDRPKIQIYTKGCPYLAKTLPRQRFDQKQPLKMANTKDDHATVALAYFLISGASLDKSLIQGERKQRPWMKIKGDERWTLGKESVR